MSNFAGAKLRATIVRLLWDEVDWHRGEIEDLNDN